MFANYLSFDLMMFARFILFVEFVEL